MGTRNKPEKPVTNFLNSYPNKKTQENYRISITHFLHAVCSPSRSGRFREPDILALRYFKELEEGNRTCINDLRNYAVLLCKKYAPTTANLYLSLTVSWLDENRHHLTRRERFRIFALLPPAYPQEENVEIKRRTFRQVYCNLPDEASVLFLVLTASGMRLGEALRLKRSDIDWGEELTEIKIPAEITKTKTSRRTYLTEEASFALLNYLRERRDTDERLFCISYHQAQRFMRNTSDLLGFTKVVNGRTRRIHWHMTRKWFISRFSLAANKDVAEHIAGHEGYLSKSYRRYSKKQIMKEYRKAEQKLSIHTFSTGYAVFSEPEVCEK